MSDNSHKPIVLCVDDDPAVVESLRNQLGQALGEDCTIAIALGGEEDLELFDDLQADGYEVAVTISDCAMPDIEGGDLLQRIQQRSPETVKILLSGRTDIDAIGRALRNARLYGYIAKPWEPEELQATVADALRHYLQAKEARTEVRKVRQANQELEELARRQAAIVAEQTTALELAQQKIARIEGELQRLTVTDDLTQIANRRYFNECLEREWQRLIGTGEPLGLILCDLDLFRRYNELYGMVSGDRSLQQVARTLAGVVQRPGDLAARYSDSVFAVLLPGAELPGVEQLAEQIRQAVRGLAIAYPDSEIADCLTVSLGGA